jgi:hypothetical protein
MLVGVGKDTARHDRLATAATKHRQSIDDTDSDADERALKAQAPRSLQSVRKTKAPDTLPRQARGKHKEISKKDSQARTNGFRCSSASLTIGSVAPSLCSPAGKRPLF